MKPLPFVWPWAVLYWVVMVWAFWPEFTIVRQAGKARTAQDGGSMHVILLGLQAAYVAAYALAFVRVLLVPAALRVAVYLFGVVLMVAGSLLRRHCWRMLGASFTGDVRAAADQAVVTRGAYARLRHPSYTAAILLNLGIGLALGSWLSAALLLIASLAVYGYRIVVEERVLMAAIGEPYRHFVNTRKRLIPYVF